jgi:anaerobic magnesium-protoporphyrin IX monomethyl ester cyclase
MSRSLLRNPVRKVLLISPPGKIFVSPEGARERKLAIPPLGPVYLAARLGEEGYEVSILDVMIDGYEHETPDPDGRTVHYGLPDDAVRARIADFDPDLIGISCLFSNRAREVAHLCRLAKETAPEAHVVLGGQHPSGMPQVVLDPNVDYAMAGEADHAFVDLITAINARGDLRQVKHVILPDGCGHWKSPTIEYPDVATLPWPAWDKIDLEKYWRTNLAKFEVTDMEEKKFIVLITSRGCPHDCSFCTATLMGGRRYRTREIDDVVAEIRANQKSYGIEEVHFWDDNFFVNSKRLKKLLRRLIHEFPELTFQTPSGTEINALDNEVIDLMAEAGFSKVFLAIESANEEIQQSSVDKKVNLDRVPQVVERIRQTGMLAEGHFMVGFPGETRAQADHTFDRAPEFGLDRIAISIVNPLPGTRLYEECEEAGLFQDDFDPHNIRYSTENLRFDDMERGYISKRRREVWKTFMEERIDIDVFERQNITVQLPATDED